MCKFGIKLSYDEEELFCTKAELLNSAIGKIRHVRLKISIKWFNFFR